jgi:predicted amidohydrolase YtcJ
LTAAAAALIWCEHVRAVHKLTWPEIVKLYRLSLDAPARNTQPRYNICPTTAAEHLELALMVEAGLTPMQAITNATANAAKLLKLDDRGVLATGKLADLVVLDGDPTTDIANSRKIHAVWHRGKKAAGPVETFTP